MVALAVLAASGEYYTPASDIGYYMGLAGGLMMLALLLYPLRKRVAFMRGWAPLKFWFALHMFLGIAGPALVLFHSTFRIGSLNAAIALGCMVLVAASGIVGRYIYRKIHRGLYGRRASLRELEAELGRDAHRIEGESYKLPSVQRTIGRFEAFAKQRPQQRMRRMQQFVSLGAMRMLTLRAIRRECAAAARGGCTGVCSRCEALTAADVRLLGAYLRQIQRVAQFDTYERLFALWHVLHVPFVYMMVISAVVHVVAVHMY